MKKSLKLALGGIAAYTAFKALDSRLDVSYYDITSEKLPEEFDNFKIAHISDYHNRPVIGLIEKIKSESPDIIAMTGDMTSDKKDESFMPAIELIQKLNAVAPCFIISGNHDTWRSDYARYVAHCRKEGAYFLQNEYLKIYKNNKFIIISGMEDVFTKVRAKSKIKESLKYFSLSDEFQILLFHRANALDEVKDFGFDLILSGHLHGGQIRIPHYKGVFSPLSSIGNDESLFFPKYSYGLYTFGNTSMIVNRGLGNPMIIPRIFNRPELGIITLKSTQNHIDK